MGWSTYGNKLEGTRKMPPAGWVPPPPQASTWSSARRCSLSVGSTVSKFVFPGEDVSAPLLPKLKRVSSRDRTQFAVPNMMLFSGAECMQKSKRSQGTGSRGRATMAVPLRTSASLRQALGNTAKILIARHRSGTPSV